MKALAAALLVLVAACGQGNIILNVDVLSFLSASDSTTRTSSCRVAGFARYPVAPSASARSGICSADTTCTGISAVRGPA